MSRELELAKKVQKEANDLTGWGFSLVPHEDACLVGTSLTKKTGQTLNVVFEIRKSAVVINTFVPNATHDEAFTKIVIENLSFPVEAKGKNGEMLILKGRIPFEILESTPTIVIKQMMIPLVDAMTKIINGGTA